MDNNKPTGLRHPSASGPYTTTTVSLNVKSEPSSLPLDRAATPKFTGFSHDITRMLDNPPINTGHRRAQSEIPTLPDDINFDDDLKILNVIEVADDLVLSNDNEEDFLSVYLDMDKFNSSSNHEAPTSIVDGIVIDTNVRTSVRHHYSQSMDWSGTIKSKMLVAALDDVNAADSKKTMFAAKLAEFALVDPKRAKRILANRQSAARSKQRKMHYICNLEKRVQSLKAEETSLFTQLTILERDIQTLIAANNELRLKIQTTVQQIHLQRALKDALREEIQQLQVLIGQTMLNGGPMKSFSYGRGHQYYPNNQTMYTLLTEQQFQQLQTRFYKWQQQQVQQQQSQQQFQHPQLLQQQQFQQLMQLQQQQQQQQLEEEEDDDDDDGYDDEP